MGLIKSLKDISLIGIGDITANGVSAIFWFYLATLILPSEYGQIHYFISIAAIASTFSLIGQQHTITVYISKNKTVISTLFLASILCSIVSFIVLALFFDKFDIGLLVIGFVLFSHGMRKIIKDVERRAIQLTYEPFSTTNGWYGELNKDVFEPIEL